MKYIILLLGAPNDEFGNLSQIALERSNCALNLYCQNDNMFFLCTGGFGKQFNTTDKPHFEYVKEYLIKNGVKPSDFLESVETSNTVDDFRMSKSIIEKEQPDVLLVVTSEFHIERAKILYNIIIKKSNVLFISAKSNLTREKLEPLMAHEKEAIDKIRSNNYTIY